MIRYIRNSKIDKNAWDRCIGHAANGIIYAYAWYLDLVCPGWDALVDDDYVSVMPLTRGKKYLMDYLYPPPFVQQLGVFSAIAPDEEMVTGFFREISEAFRFVEMNLHISNKWVPEGYSSKSMRDQILDLRRPLDEIRSSYSTNHARNIRKARLGGLEVFKNGTAGQVIDMFRRNRGRFIPAMKQSHYVLLEQLVAEALRRNMARVWLVKDRNGIPCAGAIFFESHKTGIFIFSAVTQDGKTASAMHFLIDSYIGEQHGILERLDFEGSNDPELSRFYKGFGSVEYVYLQIKNNRLPYPWRLFKN
jgi:hypothetical protein